MRRKSVLAGILCLVMALSMMPREAFAVGELPEDTAVLEALSEDIAVSKGAMDENEGDSEEAEGTEEEMPGNAFDEVTVSEEETAAEEEISSKEPGTSEKEDYHGEESRSDKDGEEEVDTDEESDTVTGSDTDAPLESTIDAADVMDVSENEPESAEENVEGEPETEAQDEVDVLEGYGNNSFGTAQDIAVNTYVEDSLISYDKDNYYKFSLASPGYVDFSFSHGYEDSSHVYWLLELYSSGNLNSSMVSKSYKGNSLYEVQDYGTGLPAGTYYIRIREDYFSSLPYKFKVNYKKTNAYEREYNDSAPSADTIEVNQQYSGNLMNYQDKDYYAFTLKSPGYIDFVFSHDYVDANHIYWQLELYDSTDLNSAMLSQAYYGNEMHTKNVNGTGLPAGKYYVRIRDEYYFEGLYHFKVQYKKSAYYEKERNNSVSSANLIKTDAFYNGNLMSYSDEDYYRFEIKQSKKLAIQFSHDFVDSSHAYWRLRLYNSTNLNSALVDWYYEGNTRQRYTSSTLYLSPGTYYMRLGDDYYSEGLYQFRLLSLKNYQTLSVKAPTSLIKGKSANITISGAKGTLSCKSSSAAAVTVSNTSKKNVFKIMAKQAGTAKLTITSAETSSYYKATKTITISVVPTGSSLKSAKNISGKKMIVVWKRNNDVSGYQVQYSLNKAFKKGNKVITEKKKTITKTTISRLAPGKTYYVRIRTYSKVGNKNYYSAWSAEKKVTVRK